ncbi:MAG TPA: winged helix-turn-helix domain-containing protein, partial [Pyrinomonadaceae bacterium]|nr:winged helix-turn-helix domain-containing protein [Pyrinomonadaceae bacterium]
MAIDPTNQSSYAFGDFQIDSVERVLRRAGELVPLTPKVFDLLWLLVENHGHVVAKERLMGEIWPDTFVEEGNLTQNISVLRKILSPNGEQYIQTVPRRGYRFVGHVRRTSGETPLVEEPSGTRLVIDEAQNPRPESAPLQPAINEAGAAGLTWGKMALISAMTLVAVAALGIGWTILGPRRVAGRNPSPFNVNNVTLRTITSTGNIAYGVISDDGQFVVYSTVDEDNRYALWLQRTGSREVLQLIPPTTHPTGPAAISHDSNWIYYGESNPSEPLKEITIYRMPLFGGSPRKVLEGAHVFAALSPNGQRILLHRFKESGGIDVVSVNALDGSDEVLIASSNVATDYLGTRWSPDGTKLLFFSIEQRAEGTYWSLSEMPAQGGAHKTILPASPRKIWFIAWADDGRGIVMTATDPVTKIPQLFYVSYPDGETRRITNDLVGYTTISVGGETIMAGKVERQSRVWVTNWPNPRPARQAIERDIADGLAWMPDGHIVYDTNDDGRLHLWMAESAGPQRQQISPDNADERQPDVSPDGKLIAFISKRSGIPALWVMDADGRNARRLTPDGTRAWRPRFAPDGQSIFFMMERNDHPFLARIPLASGEQAVIADDVYMESFFDVSPDGHRLAYSIKDNNRHAIRVVVRPVTGSSPASYFDIEPSYFLRWTPDGQSLAYAQYPVDK